MRRKKCEDCIHCKWDSPYCGHCKEKGKVYLKDDGCDKWDEGRRDKNGFPC
jgi:hypothetical protein